MAITDGLERTLGDGGQTKGMWAWTALRLALGWSFVWAFFDKLFGLGFSTCRVSDDTGAATNTIDFMCDSAMLKGGSPTYGLLEFGTQGSHTGGLFRWMASSGPDTIGIADILFMLALFFGGFALMLGVGVRIAAIGCAILMAFMFLALDVWPDTNPINSSHTIEMIAFLGIATVGPGRFALQNWMVKTFPFMSWAK
ncbi:DoxX family protein [Ilumatobacter nonamiensis]|uniref:DoxX family protein n=1 Tax=Ilumatobacter nonamiensis TaxID=467093 RepID=UPI000345AB23|nr:DoxX family protein [Ilumatobacter nonamiensis]